MAIRKGSGADSILISAFAEALGRHNAIDREKMQAVREDYILAVNRDPLAIRDPQAYNRHAGQILKAAGLGAEEPAAPLIKVIDDRVTAELAALGFSPEDFGTDSPEPINPYTQAGGPLEKAADEWATKRLEVFPFFRVANIRDQRVGIVGTGLIHMPGGIDFNIHCSTGNWTTIREADETVRIFHEGKAVTLSRDVTLPNSQGYGPFWVRLVVFHPGREFRFWINRMQNGTRSDVRKARIVMTDSREGYRRI